MASGFSYGGSCFETTAELLAHFQQQYPVVDGIYSLSASGVSIVAGPVLQYSITAKNLVTGDITSRPAGLALPSCTTGELSLTDVFAVPLLADAATAWSYGFISPLLVGLIAWAIAKVVKFS